MLLPWEITKVRSDILDLSIRHQQYETHRNNILAVDNPMTPCGIQREAFIAACDDVLSSLRKEIEMKIRMLETNAKDVEKSNAKKAVSRRPPFAF